MGGRADFDGEPMRAIKEEVVAGERAPAWTLVPSSAPRSQGISSSRIKTQAGFSWCQWGTETQSVHFSHPVCPLLAGTPRVPIWATAKHLFKSPPI